MMTSYCKVGLLHSVKKMMMNYCKESLNSLCKEKLRTELEFRMV